MKVLLVAGKLTYSNSARYTLALVHGLQARGHEVQVAASGGPLFSTVANLASDAYHVKFNYFSYRKLVHFLEEFGPAVIHATGGSMALKTATRLARSLDIPLIHTIHSWLASDRSRDAYRHVEGVIAPNEGLREHLVNDQGFPKNRIRVIPYGIEVLDAPESPEAESAAGSEAGGADGEGSGGSAAEGAESGERAAMERGGESPASTGAPKDPRGDGEVADEPGDAPPVGVAAPTEADEDATSADNKVASSAKEESHSAANSEHEEASAPAMQRIPVVGTIGRLEKGRRHSEFVEAAERVREAARDVHFVIAGEGPGENSLRRLVKKHSLEDALTFVQPQSTHSDIYGILDILVIISDWGGVGFNLLEGLARGRPVIATGGGEVYSVLGEEQVCEIVPAGNTEELATAILGLLSNPKRRLELAHNGREFVRQHYPLEGQIVRVEDYYSEVCTQRTS